MAQKITFPPIDPAVAGCIAAIPASATVEDKAKWPDSGFAPRVPEGWWRIDWAEGVTEAQKTEALSVAESFTSEVVV